MVVGSGPPRGPMAGDHVCVSEIWHHEKHSLCDTLQGKFATASAVTDLYIDQGGVLQ